MIPCFPRSLNRGLGNPAAEIENEDSPRMKRTFSPNGVPGIALLLLVAGWMALEPVAAMGQHNPAPAAGTPAEGSNAAPAYDVVSIREFKPEPGGYRAGMRFNPDGINATALSLKSLLCTAYGVSFYEVSGGPEWVESDLYSVQAKMDESAMEVLAKLPPDQAWKVRQQMFQAVLADRFKLKFHREAKQLGIFSLVVAKNEPRLTVSNPVAPSTDTPASQGASQPRGTMRMRSGPDGIEMTAQGETLDQLVTQLAGEVHTRVENKTGLTGNYDFTLRYAPGGGLNAPNSESSAPSIFTALQEQLGLKLEPHKGPVEVLVIDHVERPSEN